MASSQQQQSAWRPATAPGCTGVWQTGVLGTAIAAGEMELLAAVNRETQRRDLLAAAAGGKTVQVQTLLAAKASIDVADYQGSTPLMHSCPTELLLATKASVDQATHKGSTALMIASKSGQSATTELLLAAKANAGQVNNEGSTALVLASKNTPHR